MASNRILCRECLYPAKLTTWLPPGGIDPALRKYECTSPTCRVIFYYREPVKQLSQKELQARVVYYFGF